VSQLSPTIPRLLLACALASVSGSATANLIVDYQSGSISNPVHRLAEFRDDGTFVRELATGLPLGSNTHLAEVGPLIYRSSSVTDAPIHVLDRNGNLVRTVFNDAVYGNSTAV
jgi:hypothetical protein